MGFFDVALQEIEYEGTISAFILRQKSSTRKLWRNPLRGRQPLEAAKGNAVICSAAEFFAIRPDQASRQMSEEKCSSAVYTLTWLAAPRATVKHRQKGVLNVRGIGARNQREGV